MKTKSEIDFDSEYTVLRTLLLQCSDKGVKRRMQILDIKIWIKSKGLTTCIESEFELEAKLKQMKKLMSTPSKVTQHIENEMFKDCGWDDIV